MLNAGPFIYTAASPTTMAVNAYKTPAFYGLNRLVFTNTTPTTAYRGAGRPNVAYLVERLVDEAARVTGIDRVALRDANLLPKMLFLTRRRPARPTTVGRSAGVAPASAKRGAMG